MVATTVATTVRAGLVWVRDPSLTLLSADAVAEIMNPCSRPRIRVWLQIEKPKKRLGSWGLSKQGFQDKGASGEVTWQRECPSPL